MPSPDVAWEPLSLQQWQNLTLSEWEKMELDSTLASASIDLTYDAWNRLVKAVRDSKTLGEYEYDGLNRRTLKKEYDDAGILSATRHYYYSTAWQVLEERIDTDTTPDRQYVWGLRYVDDLILRDRDTTGDGTLDERLYSLSDANWNVIALADTSGVVQERYAYDAYGNVSILTDSYANRDSSSYDWNYLFTTRELDSESGIYNYRNRYYDWPC